MSKNKPINVLTVHTHPIVAQGIRSILLADQRFAVEIVQNGNDCLKKMKEYKSDIVLIDLELKDIYIIDLIGHLKKEDLNVKVLILAELSHEAYIIPAFSKGVSGFLPKNCSADELLEAIDNVCNNQIYLSPDFN